MEKLHLHATDATIQPAICPMPDRFAALEQLATEVIGKSLAEASKMVEDAGYVCRVEMQDGVTLMVTGDANPRRLSFAIEDGIVASARRK